MYKLNQVKMFDALTCSTNQWAVFYMVGTSALKEVNILLTGIFQMSTVHFLGFSRFMTFFSFPLNEFMQSETVRRLQC